MRNDEFYQARLRTNTHSNERGKLPLKGKVRARTLVAVGPLRRSFQCGGASVPQTQPPVSNMCETPLVVAG
jgi:hypothetical protein